MQRFLVAVILASASLLIFPNITIADILIDFENTPNGVFSSYTEQGVTFTALSGGMMTSDYYGNAPNGTRGLIGMPISGGGGGEEGGGGGSGGEGFAPMNLPGLPSPPTLPGFPGFPPFEFPTVPTNPVFPGEGDATPEGYFPALRADFSFVANFVCVDLGDFGSDEDHIFMTAFDAMGNQIGHVSSWPGADPGEMKTLWIANPGISYVIFGSMSPSTLGSSVFADNFCARGDFPVDAVPEFQGTTSIMMLFAVSVGGGIALRRRSRAMAAAA